MMTINLLTLWPRKIWRTETKQKETKTKRKNKFIRAIIADGRETLTLGISAVLGFGAEKPCTLAALDGRWCRRQCRAEGAEDAI